MASPRPAWRQPAALALAWALTWLVAPSTSRAAPGADPPAQQPLAEAIELSAGATCLDRQTLVEDLESWRDEPSIDARVEIEIHGDATQPRALSFVVRVDGREAVVRRFDDAPRACADLHAVVALAIAIALDDSLAPELGIVANPTDALEPVEQVEAGDDDLPRFDRRPRPQPNRPGPALALTPLALVSAGLTPRLSGGAGLSFDIRPRDHFDLRLGGFVVHEGQIPLAGASAAMTVAAGRLDLCWGTAPLAVRLRLCAGVASGAIIARGQGQATTRTGAIPWVAAIADVDVAVHLIGPLALEFRIEGVFPFIRPRFEATDPNDQVIDSIEPQLAGLLVGLGPRLEF